VHGSTIHLTDLLNLKIIERDAFHDFVGELQLTGEAPMLEAINEYVFQTLAPILPIPLKDEGRIKNLVNLTELRSLTAISADAFHLYLGLSMLTGPFTSYRGPCVYFQPTIFEPANTHMDKDILPPFYV
jgi:hypothetical protein